MTTKCKAMFCTMDGHEPDMRHVDVTGHPWEEDTSGYVGEVIAHVYDIEGDHQ